MKNFLYLIVLLSIFSCNIRYDGLREGIKAEAFNCIIIDVYQDRYNHNIWILKTDCDEEKEINGNVWPRCWEYMEVGDSVIKMADTLLLTVKKTDGQMKEFYYKF